MILLLILAAALTPPPAAGIQGRWTNPGGNVTILIAPCGDAYCGTVTAASNKAKTDSAEHGTSHLVGTRLLTDFAPDADGRWSGRLFVPDIPITTDASIERTGTNQLKVTGCELGGLLCKSQLWTRLAGKPRRH
jgi:uncharacterized protein (DUF2147 family)